MTKHTATKDDMDLAARAPCAWSGVTYGSARVDGDGLVVVAQWNHMLQRLTRRTIDPAKGEVWFHPG